MSEALVQVPAGDMKEDQPESLNVETAQSSLLKKSSLFGTSMAMSPQVGDGSPSPAEKSSDNGNEEVSQGKNGDADDSNANGDHQEGEIDASNGDSAEEANGDDEEMAVDEPESAADNEDKPVEDAKPSEPTAPAAVDETEEEEEEKAAEIEDIDMDDDETEEDEVEEVKAPAKDDVDEVKIDAVEPAKEDAVVDEEEEKEEEEKPAEPKEDEEEPAAEEKDEVEEICVKKVISMDTDETAEEEPTEGAKAAESSLDVTQDASLVEEEEKNEEEEEVVVTPVKRGRGRPPKSASSTPLAVKKAASAAKTPKTPAAAAAVDEDEEAETPAKRTPRGAAKKAAESLAAPPPSVTKSGRGRRSIKSDTSSQPDVDEKKEGEVEEEKEEVKEGGEEEQEEVKTPAAARGRRSVKSTPATATRGSPRGRKPAEEKEEEEEAEEKEDDGEGEDKKEEEGDDEEVAAEKTPRRGRRSTVATPAGKKETPARASRSAKKEKGGEEAEGAEEKEDTASLSPARRSTRGSPTKTPAQSQSPAKGRGRKSSVKSEETVETEEEEFGGDEGEKKKGRGRGRKSVSAKTPSSSAKKGKKGEEEEDEVDPFEIDTELDKHPEPLRNITVEKGTFGEMKYMRSPLASKSKYAATERSASDKVANLPNTPAATGTPKTIASAQSTRKSLGGSPAKAATRTPSARKSSAKKEGGEETEEDEDMDEPMEEGEEGATPAEGRKSRGRPAGSGSTGRKRKAEETPAAASAAKRRPQMAVSIPTLDAEAQWAADHPEDDSAPLVPGARVYAVFQKIFYPALVGDRDGLGRYMVEFVEDQIVRPVPPAGVVPLSAVTIDKECLYASTPAADPVQCRVLRSANAANAREWQEGVFKLAELKGETEHEAKWNQLQLDMATGEWKKYVNAKSKNITKIMTDNITSLEDRRERRSRVHNDTAVAIAALSGTPEPSGRRVSGGGTARKTPGAAKTPAAKTPGTGRRGRKSKATLAAEAAAAAAAAGGEEATGDEEEEEEGAEKEKKGKKEEEAEGEAEEKMDTDEPAEEAKKPEMNPRIFLNKTFILTSANRTTGDVVFKKNEMKKQILERGGVVVEDINQVPLDAEAYLISDTHYRTHKYLAAMSRGMPCLSHKWLVECVAREALAPYDAHKLAGGQGLLNGELYPLPDVRGKLLVGRSIMVHSKTDSSMKRGTMGFKQIWSPIVELLGARVVSDGCLVDGSWATTAPLPDFEILLTDSSCPPEIVHKLEAAGKAVVSSEWLIQSIIMGGCPDFSAHPRFRYDSGNEPAKKEGSQEQAAPSASASQS